MANASICSINDCNKHAIKKGLCNGHYLRQWRHGSPEAGNAMFGAPLEFVERLLTLEPTTECILWPFGTSIGYGMMRVNGRAIRAHRYVCIRRHGRPTFKRYQAAHSCDNKLCVNPAHLRWATPVENREDFVAMHGNYRRGGLIK